MAPANSEKIDAYKTHQNKMESGRDIEARALLICASQMDAACKDADNRQAIKDAVRRNQQLWTILQVALCDPANPLPVELKNLLLNLSCYIDKISFRALQEFQPALLQELIQINRNIANGLSKKMQSSEPASMPPPDATPSPVMTSA